MPKCLVEVRETGYGAEGERGIKMNWRWRRRRRATAMTHCSKFGNGRA